MRGDRLDFAPTDPTDGRKRHDWKSRYPRSAQAWMVLEALYLIILLAIAPICIFLLWRGKADGHLLGLHKASDIVVVWRYTTAWLAGTVGGTIFATKWLYHSVARGRWHVDRRYWRLLTPHLSGGLAFGFYAIATSSLLLILDHAELDHGATIVALSFLVGYFSDNATAALTRLADRVFGDRDERKARPTVDRRDGSVGDAQVDRGPANPEKE
jgi:hypothetical protein